MYELGSRSTILVPLDGTALGEVALQFAEALGLSSGATLLLVHVLCPSSGAEEITRARAYLDQVAERLSASTRVRTTVLVGHVVQAILDEVRCQAAQFIVIAGRFECGTTAERLLMRAEVPVLLIPPLTCTVWPETGNVKVLVALGGSRCAEAALPPAVAIANCIASELILLDVVDPTVDGLLVADPAAQLARSHAYLEQISAGLHLTRAQVRTCAELGRPARTINRIAHRENAELLVLGKHGWSGMARMLPGRLATEVLEQTDLPVLLVP